MAGGTITLTLGALTINKNLTVDGGELDVTIDASAMILRPPCMTITAVVFCTSV
jgi:hypothetical protein